MSAPEPRTWVIEMPAGMELLTMNQRVHWAVRSRVSRALRETACWLARKERIPQLREVSVIAVYQPPDRRRRDPANWHPSVKAVIDGIVDSGVIEDDDSAHLRGPLIRLGNPFPKGRLVLHIEEVAGEG